MSELSELKNAINNLTSAMSKAGGGHGGSGASMGMTAGLTEGLIGASAITKLNTSLETLVNKLGYGLSNTINSAIADITDAFSRVNTVFKRQANDLANLYSQHAHRSGEGFRRTEFLNDKENKAKEKTAFTFGKLISGAAILGGVMKGLSGTIEGFKLDMAFKSLFYQMADLARGPVRSFTKEVNGAAYVLRHLNKGGVGNALMITASAYLFQSKILAAGNWLINGFNKILPMAARGVGKTVGMGLTHPLVLGIAGAEFEALRGMKRTAEFGRDFSKLKMGRDGWYDPVQKKAQDEASMKVYANQKKDSYLDANFHKEAKKDSNDHLQMMFSTNFSSLQSLWENMQKSVTENPGIDEQEKTNSILQGIYDYITGTKHDVPETKLSPVGA